MQGDMCKAIAVMEELSANNWLRMDRLAVMHDELRCAWCPWWHMPGNETEQCSMCKIKERRFQAAPSEEAPAPDHAPARRATPVLRTRVQQLRTAHIQQLRTAPPIRRGSDAATPPQLPTAPFYDRFAPSAVV